MAQWGLVQGFTAVRSYYGPQFPLELRHYFADWLESQNWDAINTAAPTAEDEANSKQLVEMLCAALDQRVRQLAATPAEDNFLLRLRLEEIAKEFQERYAANSLEWIRVVQAAFRHEAAELRREQEEGDDKSQQPANPEQAAARVSQFQQMTWRVKETNDEMVRLQQMQESFVIEYQEMCKLEALQKQYEQQAKEGHQSSITAQIQAIQKKRASVESVLAQGAETLVKTRQVLHNKFLENIQTITQLQNSVLTQPLKEWHLKQQLGRLPDKVLTAELDSLQLWAEHLAELVWRTRQQVRQMVMLQTQLPLNMHGGSLFSELFQPLMVLLSQLVHGTFVIDKQPPRVLKTQTKFAATARFLVGSKLNVHMDYPEVVVTIVNEAQARLIDAAAKSAASGEHDAQRAPNNHGTSGDILNNRKVMAYNQATNALRVDFKNMSLRKIKRGDSKADQVVTEEKFSIVIKTTFSIGGGELSFTVQRLSLPVVVVVHGNQLPNAEATMLWDRAFAVVDRVPFAVPHKVPWRDLAVVLNQYFSSVAVRPLSEENCKYLASKAFKESEGPHDDENLTWQAFNKDSMAGRTFTFWEWFFGIADLTRKHLVGPWQDGSILGFVSKNQAQEMLENMANGTFLLRYSDSELGGVTVAWIGEDDNKEKQVWHLSPWFPKDFTIRSLPDRIHDLPQLQILYPDIPKDAVFQKYYSPVEARSQQNYVASSIAAVIPSQSGPQQSLDVKFNVLQLGLLGQEFGDGNYDLNMPDPMQLFTLANSPMATDS